MAIEPTTIDTFVANQTSPETRRAYARDVRVFLSWLGAQAIEAVTDSEAIAFRDWLLARYTPAGATRVWSTVKMLYRFAHQMSGFDTVKGPKRIKDEAFRVPDDEDVEALVSAASAPDKKGRVNARRSLVVPLLLNGLRASEVGDLRKTGIERHQGAIILRVIGKGQRERLVPATTEVELALIRYEALSTYQQKRSEFVVTDEDGGPLNYRQVEHDVYTAAAKAGVECHPHALRHHYATRLIRSGADSMFVQQLLGHKRLDTTQRYVTLDLSDLIKAARKDPRNILTPTEAVG